MATNFVNLSPSETARAVQDASGERPFENTDPNAVPRYAAPKSNRDRRLALVAAAQRDGKSKDEIYEILRVDAKLQQAKKEAVPPPVATGGVVDKPTPMQMPVMGELPGTIRLRDVEMPAGAVNFAAGAGSEVAGGNLGVQQGLASIGLGDPAELQRRAIEKRKLDAPLMRDPQGRAGARTGGMAMDIATGMGVGSMLPRTGALSYAGNVPVTGALNELRTPETGKYEPLDKIAKGAVIGTALDAGMRLGQRVARPGLSGTAPTREAAERLEAQGMPNVGPGNVSDNATLRSMVDIANAMTFGRVTRNQQANKDWYNRQVTPMGGTESARFGPTERAAMHKELDDQAKVFRAGPDVPIGSIPAHLRTVANDVADDYANATSNPGIVNRLRNAADAAATQPRQTSALPTRGSPNTLTVYHNQPTMSANDIMDLRIHAGKLAHSTEDTKIANQYRALRNAYDDALENTMTDAERESFRTWKQEWGGKKELERAVMSSADRTAEQITPSNMSRAFPEESVLRPGGDPHRSPAMHHAENVTQDARLALPETTGKGSYLASALLLSPAALSGGAGALTDRMDVGAGAAGLSTAALIAALTSKRGRWLTREALDPETSALARNLVNRSAQGYIDLE